MAEHALLGRTVSDGRVMPLDTANAFLAFIEKHEDCPGEIVRIASGPNEAGKRFRCRGCGAECVLGPHGSEELARMDAMMRGRTTR